MEEKRKGEGEKEEERETTEITSSGDRCKERAQAGGDRHPIPSAKEEGLGEGGAYLLKGQGQLASQASKS